MKLTLAIATPRSRQGTLIPVQRFPFLIGQAPGCHLRARDSTISPRHCAWLIHENRFFARNLGGNATFVNGEPVDGERELHNGDSLHAGCLTFAIQLESSMSRPQIGQVRGASVEAAKEAAEEAAASLLLAMEDQEEPTRSMTATSARDGPGQPMDTDGVNAGKAHLAKSRSPQPDLPDTAAVAGMLIEKFRRSHGQEKVVAATARGARPADPVGKRQS